MLHITITIPSRRSEMHRLMDGAGPQATISSPFFCTRCSSLSAVPVGRFWPISHFCTVETLVFRRAAKTAWLTFDVSRMRLIWARRSGGVGARLRWSNSRIVTWSIAPAACSPFAVACTASRIFDGFLRMAVYLDDFASGLRLGERGRCQLQQCGRQFL